MSARDLPADCFPSSVCLSSRLSLPASFRGASSSLLSQAHKDARTYCTFSQDHTPPALTEAVIFSRRRAFVCGNVGVGLQYGEVENSHYRGEKRRSSGG